MKLPTIEQSTEVLHHQHIYTIAQLEADPETKDLKVALSDAALELAAADKAYEASREALITAHGI